MKKLFVILSLALLQTLPIKADDCRKCLDAVKAAEEYITLLEDDTSTKATIIRRLQAENDLIKQDLADLESREKAWYNNQYIWGAAGILLGVAVSK